MYLFTQLKDQNTTEMSKIQKSLFLLTVLGMLTATTVVPTEKDSTSVKINILETTDTHAYQYGHSFLGLDATFSDYSAFVTQYTAKNPDTLVLDSGDITQGTAVSAYILPAGSGPLSTFFDIPNIISTVGNHDLNAGAADYIKYVSHASPSPWEGRMITSNIRMKEDPSVPMGNALWTTRTVAGQKIAIVGAIYTEINGDRTFKHKPDGDSTCWQVDSDNVYVLWPNQTFNNAPISYTYTDINNKPVSVSLNPADNVNTNFPAWIAKEKPDMVIALCHIPTFLYYDWTTHTGSQLHPDLVLNYEALRAVPGLETLPLVFLTGHSHIWDQSACKLTDSKGKEIYDKNCYVWNGDKYDEVFGIIELEMTKNSSGLFLENPENARTRVNTSIALMEKALGEPLNCDVGCQEINITIASQISRVDAWDFYGYLAEDWTHACPYEEKYSIYNMWLKYFSPEILKSDINMIGGGNIRRGAYAGNNYFEDLVEIYPFADEVTQLTGVTPELLYYVLYGKEPAADLEPADYPTSTWETCGSGYYVDPPLTTLTKGKAYTIIYDSYDVSIINKACKKLGLDCTMTILNGADGQPLQIRDEFYSWFKTTYGKNDTHPTHLMQTSLPSYVAPSATPASVKSTTSDSKPVAKSSATEDKSEAPTHTIVFNDKYAHMTKGDIAATVIVLTIVCACLTFFCGCCVGKRRASSYT